MVTNVPAHHIGAAVSSGTLVTTYNQVQDYVMFQRIIILSLSGSWSGNVLGLCFELMESTLPLTQCHITENFIPNQYMCSLLWENEISHTVSVSKSTDICILNNMYLLRTYNELRNEDSEYFSLWWCVVGWVVASVSKDHIARSLRLLHSADLDTMMLQNATECSPNNTVQCSRWCNSQQHCCENVKSDKLRTANIAFSYNKSQQDELFLNFILVKNSTCFGQIYCPSSGVLILYSQQ